ncbi:MAG: aromatic ring-hydroxylating dioxygenase subunit alpha, partial [Sutterellaceae bacterium]|nr:aromatic ring-hydroxylating dioxygenase subunit alpha [Burkholderiaceae bacterium]MDW8430053.1 aromatic ring-hydroxylating dioxygenase subunit alpha [Sutterellaceae bacterium]
VAALEDWCPHRGAPLSLGRVEQGRLVCGYHGLQMGCDGKVLAMPGQRVQGFPSVRAYPALERYGYVWVWPGEAARADPALLPRLSWAEDPGWAFGGGLYHVRCDYRLMIDNLMDLTHEKYVHADSIGQKELDEVVPQTTVEGGTVLTRREMHNVQAPPFWQAAMRGNGLDAQAPVDRWQRCRFVPPSNVFIEVGVALAGHGGFAAPAAVKTSGIVVDLITPETDTSMWYFWGLARDFRPQDQALTASIREAQGRIFAEDIAILEAQQRNLSAQPQRRLLSLNTDLGGVQARRIIERLVAAEREAAPALAA